MAIFLIVSEKYEKKKILFIHQNFPAQFKALAPHLSNDKRYEIHTLANQQSSDSDSKPYLKENEKYETSFI